MQKKPKVVRKYKTTKRVGTKNKKAKTNPYGANHTIMDPRQALFWNFYLDRNNPKTFSNGAKSALAAGFSDSYGKAIIANSPKWLVARLQSEDTVAQAEKNLKKFLSDKEDDKKIKSDMTKFTLTRLAKSKYSERTEHTGIDGKEINVKVIQYKD